MANIWKNIKGFINVIWLSIRDAMHDKIFRMSAALAFYSIFSIAPMLILIISIANTFFRRKAVEGEVYGQIRDFVGDDAAIQIQEIIANSMLSHQAGIATIISAGVLIFTATGVFTEIQDSINAIWCLKPKPKKGWLKMIINRLLSFSMLVSLGFLLMITLMINALLNGIGNRLTNYFPVMSVYYAYIINWVITFATTVILFGGIFKVLPDAIIKWRHVLIGSIFTAALFLLGKWGIGIYLGQSKVNTTFGAAGSTMIVLLWVYYSAIILYMGAEFTKHFAQWKGSRIFPTDYAVWVEKVEIEREDELGPLKE